MSLESISNEDGESGLLSRGISLGLGSALFSLYALPSLSRIFGYANRTLGNYEDLDGESDTSLGGIGMIVGAGIGIVADIVQAGVAGYLAFNGHPEWAIGIGTTNAVSGACELVKRIR